MKQGADVGDSTGEVTASTRASFADDDAEALQGLRAASIHDLRVEWRRTFRRHPPPGLNRSLLFGMIAYQRQADVFGDLEHWALPLSKQLLEPT